MKVISLLGLPGSGKSFYGKNLARKFKARFLPEIATRLIYEKGYTPGMKGSIDFDKDILKNNCKTAKEVLQSCEFIVWEGGPVQDVIFLKGRMNLVGEKDRREELLKAYNNVLFDQLKKETLYAFFNVNPEVSLERQNLRMKPELLTTSLKILQFVNENLMQFYRNNLEKVILININKSRKVVQKEVYDKVASKFDEIK